MRVSRSKTAHGRTCIAPLVRSRSNIRGTPSANFPRKLLLSADVKKFDPTKTWTPRGLISFAKEQLSQTRIDRKQYFSEVFIATLLGISRREIYTESHREIPADQLQGFAEGLERLAKGEPISTLTGQVAFNEIRLTSKPGIFIPSPETENLVEFAVELIREITKGREEESSLKIMDLCTGIANIAISLVTTLRDLYVEINATDNSPKAIEVAKENIQRLDLTESINVFGGDLFNCEGLIPQYYDIIIGNPPYKPTIIAQKLGSESQPSETFDGGKNGLDLIRRILAEAVSHTKSTGFLLFEFAIGQEKEIEHICKESEFWKSYTVLRRSRGESAVFIATPQEGFDFSFLDVIQEKETPLVKAKGSAWEGKNLRYIARELRPRIKELEQALDSLAERAEVTETMRTRVRITELIEDAKKLLDIAENKKSGTLNDFEVIRIHLEAIDLCDIILPKEKPRLVKEYFNNDFIRRKEALAGSISEFSMIFILMDILTHRIDKFRKQIKRIPKGEAWKTFTKTKDFERLLAHCRDQIAIAKSFTVSKPNPFGERLSFTVKSNWTNILYGLGFSIGKAEEAIHAIKTVMDQVEGGPGIVPL